jgi:hypothetical protein
MSSVIIFEHYGSSTSINFLFILISKFKVVFLPLPNSKLVDSFFCELEKIFSTNETHLNVPN